MVFGSAMMARRGPRIVQAGDTIPMRSRRL
jgi:hypothetical protein